MTMNGNKKTYKAFDILHRRYIGENAERQASFETERVNAEVARTIYDLRKKAGLTQKELGQIVGTTQSVISRLEDADYEGHSLSMLHRIAMALNRRLSVQMVEPIDEREATVHQESQVPCPDRTLFSDCNLLTGLKTRGLAPMSGQYQQTGPRGAEMKEGASVKGEPLPPTSKKIITYNLIDTKKNKSGKK
jgi:transcriptional regulator with XRE-family HTH domain